MNQRLNMLFNIYKNKTENVAELKVKLEQAQAEQSKAHNDVIDEFDSQIKDAKSSE